MGPDPRPDSPEDGTRPGQGSGRADENQAAHSAQFAAGQRFDTEKAGLPLAAALAGVQAGLESLDDDALAGFLGGCQKIAAWAAGMLLDGIAEFAGRRPGDGTPGRAVLYAAAVKKARAALAAGEPADPPECDEFTADELMPVLRLSKGGAQRQVGLALALRYRLRATLAALLGGRIDVIRADHRRGHLRPVRGRRRRGRGARAAPGREADLRRARPGRRQGRGPGGSGRSDEAA